jgi:hypothetical protein
VCIIARYQGKYPQSSVGHPHLGVFGCMLVKTPKSFVYVAFSIWIDMFLMILGERYSEAVE